mmetsp:Transcript_6025/g.17784  ORF Transcript_6025/g.17784 Transcript_6025/m.17784 type:complete len:250 (-) Transcript_6025:2-751(-)
MVTMPSNPSSCAFLAQASTVESTPSPSTPSSTRALTASRRAAKRSGARGTRNSPSSSAQAATTPCSTSLASSIFSSALSTMTDSVEARLSASAASFSRSSAGASSQSSAMRRKNCGRPTARKTASCRTFAGSEKTSIEASSYIKLSVSDMPAPQSFVRRVAGACGSMNAPTVAVHRAQSASAARRGMVLCIYRWIPLQKMWQSCGLYACPRMLIFERKLVNRFLVPCRYTALQTMPRASFAERLNTTCV